MVVKVIFLLSIFDLPETKPQPIIDAMIAWLKDIGIPKKTPICAKSAAEPNADTDFLGSILEYSKDTASMIFGESNQEPASIEKPPNRSRKGMLKFRDSKGPTALPTELAPAVKATNIPMSKVRFCMIFSDFPSGIHLSNIVVIEKPKNKEIKGINSQ